MSKTSNDKPKTKQTKSKKNNDSHLETSKSIQEKTKAFLEAGGVINKINSGVSGYRSNGGKRQIVLSSESSKK